MSCGVIRSSMPIRRCSSRSRAPRVAELVPSSRQFFADDRGDALRTGEDVEQVGDLSIITSRYSATILSCSRPVRRCRRSSRMAWAWASDRR